MKVDSGTPVKTIGDAPTSTPDPTVKARQDRITTVESSNVATLVDSAKRAVSQDRGARLQQIEASVRSGTFRPDPTRIAEEILSQAETDARLRAAFHDG